eukprot:922915_1
MSTFWAILSLVIVIHQTTSQSINCNGDCTCPTKSSKTTCTLNCVGKDQCKDAELRCRSGDPCVVNCQGESSCGGNTIIDASQSTDVRIKCSGKDACKGNTEINCGTASCDITCAGGTSCEDTTATADSATAFACTGSCPRSFPREFTANPTKEPTFTPTQTPTLVPTSTPTETPTKYPTLVPTAMPTETPTQNPTLVPTLRPTETPTQNPTETTYSPSLEPTEGVIFPVVGKEDCEDVKRESMCDNHDDCQWICDDDVKLETGCCVFEQDIDPTKTKTPTIDPTLEPTAIHTKTPTGTKNHTNKPTPFPTTQPTRGPTTEPTRGPTNGPTLEPTRGPTNKPTKTPTFSPFTTSKPSHAPLSHSDIEDCNIQWKEVCEVRAYECAWVCPEKYGVDSPVTDSQCCVPLYIDLCPFIEFQEVCEVPDYECEWDCPADRGVDECCESVSEELAMRNSELESNQSVLADVVVGFIVLFGVCLLAFAMYRYGSRKRKSKDMISKLMDDKMSVEMNYSSI